MTPPDDWLPEERAEQHMQLIALLQRAYRASVVISPEQQERIRARVYGRLRGVDAELPREQTRPGQLTAGIVPSLRGAVSPAAGSPRRRGRFIRLSALLATVLVIGAIIGTSLLISLSRPQTTGSPTVGLLGKPVTIHTQAGGLEATVQITAGPYFLGELIATDLSVTNHTHTTFLMEEQIFANPCDKREFGIMMTGGGSPHYTSPLAEKPVPVPTFSWQYLNGCYSPILPIFTAPWKPSQTIAVQQYLILTSSGRVTLAAGGTFFTIDATDNGNYIVPTSGPLDGHWPSLQINVQSQVPPDRMISLKRQGEQVSVSAPLDAHNHLVYTSYLNCTWSNGARTGAAPTLIWKPLSTTVLHQAHCPDIGQNGRIYHGKFVLWDYGISAPGYAIAWGSEPA